MKKFFALILLAVLTINFAGCATLNIEGRGQTLAMPDQAWKEYKTYKSFYLFAGLVPISNTSTEDKLPPSGKVYIRKRFNVVDWFIGALSFGILYTETITVYSE